MMIPPIALIYPLMVLPVLTTDPGTFKKLTLHSSVVVTLSLPPKLWSSPGTLFFALAEVLISLVPHQEV